VLNPRPSRQDANPHAVPMFRPTYSRTFRLLLNLISQFSNITLRASSSTFYLCLDINLLSLQSIICHRLPRVLSSIQRKAMASSTLHLPTSHALWKLGFHRVSIAPSRLMKRGSWGDSQNILIHACWLASISPTRCVS
jgi:hypothetical protein